MKVSVLVTFRMEDFARARNLLKEHGIKYVFKHDHIEEPFKYWYKKGEPHDPQDNEFKDIYEIRVRTRDEDQALRLIYPEQYV